MNGFVAHVEDESCYGRTILLSQIETFAGNCEQVIIELSSPKRLVVAVLRTFRLFRRRLFRVIVLREIRLLFPFGFLTVLTGLCSSLAPVHKTLRIYYPQNED
jgi:hypothetical protein